MSNVLSDIKVPKIIKSLHFGDYDKSLQGQSLRVWINPPEYLVLEFEEMQAVSLKIKQQNRNTGVALFDKLLFNKMRMKRVEQQVTDNAKRIYAWYATIWGQDPNSPMSTEDVRSFAIRMQTEEGGDVGLWRFITNNTVKMISEHREGLEKN